MKFIFCSYDGYPFSIAKRLMDEGCEVIVCQVEDKKELGVESGLNNDNDEEEKKRRLSIYSGILKKLSLTQLIRKVEAIDNKDEWFVVFDYPNLYKISEHFLKLGFSKGIFPTEEDFNREKDRQESKNFVIEHYPDIQVAPVQEFTKIDDAISVIKESNTSFALKSDGNFADTVVPLTKDLDFAKEALINALKTHKSDWEKGKFTLEEKIIDPIEINVEMAFWDGEPIYSQVEIETRMFGAGDVGFQTGGNQNLTIATKFNDKINKMCFPPIIYKMAKKRKGLWLADCGLMFKKGEDKPYFTEFAGNRWGWGGIFSELAMSRDGEYVCSEYFEKVAAGMNPYSYKFGATLSIYNILPDKDEAGLYRQDIPVRWKEEIEPVFFPYQIRMETAAEARKDANDEDDMEPQVVNVGYSNNLLGYTTGYGNTIEDVADKLYSFENKFDMYGAVYRPKFDFLSTDYPTSIPNRFKFLNHTYFEAPDFLTQLEEAKKFKEDVRKKLYGYIKSR